LGKTDFVEIAMKRTVLTAIAALTLLLGGCATTIRSDVTTFHQWPAQLQDKTYVFDAPPPQDDTLELRSYQNLVRAELAKLGFQETSGAPALKVAMRFTTTDVPVQVVEYDPFFYSSARYGFSPYRYGWGPYRRSYFGPGWYDPFWGGMAGYEVRVRHNYQRDLQVAIRSATDNRRLFDVTVHNNSTTRSTPAVMPALVQSAFAGFPGPNGASRRIELRQEG
jgi:hypothetical protein